MQEVHGLGYLESDFDSLAPARYRDWTRRRIGVNHVVQAPVQHELDDEERILDVVGAVAEEVDEPRAPDLGEDLELVVEFAADFSRFRRSLDGDETGADDGFVDAAVASASEEVVGGESACRGFEVAVEEAA